MTIFRRELIHNQVPKYLDGVSGFANGGTVYRSQLKLAYDKTGQVIRNGLKRVIKDFFPGAVIAYDIEELGYNSRPNGTEENQIEFILTAKALRSDCQHGYYNVFCHSVNAMAVDRPAFEKKEYLSADLAAAVDFVAPRMYPMFEGVISKENGVPPFITQHWKDGYHYGFKDWADNCDWVVGLCKRWHRPIYPFLSPYALLNKPDGTYGTGRLNYPVSYFEKAIQHILSTADGMFFFDRSRAAYEPQDERRIAGALQRNLLCVN